MIFTSLKNFSSTYLGLFWLVFSREKRELILIAVVYLFSFFCLAIAFLMVLAILKSTILKGDFGFQLSFEFIFAGYRFSAPKILGMVVLGCFFLTSSLCAYIAERRWFVTIQNIVSLIAQEKVKISNAEQKRQIRIGAISTIRVSGMLLNILSPSLIAIFSLIFLFYFQWKLGVFTAGLVFASTFLYLIVGRKTKRISAGLIDDDDDSVQVESDDSSSMFERLAFISNLFQLKARSKLIANFLFILFVSGLMFYMLTIPKDAEDVYELVVSCSLIYLCFNGIKVFGSKAVPLSRQYNYVKEFISVPT